MLVWCDVCLFVLFDEEGVGVFVFVCLVVDCDGCVVFGWFF